MFGMYQVWHLVSRAIEQQVTAKVAGCILYAIASSSPSSSFPLCHRISVAIEDGRKVALPLNVFPLVVANDCTQALHVNTIHTLYMEVDVMHSPCPND